MRTRLSVNISHFGTTPVATTTLSVAHVFSSPGAKSTQAFRLIIHALAGVLLWTPHVASTKRLPQRPDDRSHGGEPDFSSPQN